MQVVTLVASIYIYGHSLNGIQTLGLVVSFSAMISGFFEKKGKGGHGHGHGGSRPSTPAGETGRGKDGGEGGRGGRSEEGQGGVGMGAADRHTPHGR